MTRGWKERSSGRGFSTRLKTSYNLPLDPGLACLRALRRRKCPDPRPLGGKHRALRFLKRLHQFVSGTDFSVDHVVGQQHRESSLPTSSRAVSTAWPSPSASFWRT